MIKEAARRRRIITMAAISLVAAVIFASSVINTTEIEAVGDESAQKVTYVSASDDTECGATLDRLAAREAQAAQYDSAGDEAELDRQATAAWIYEGTPLVYVNGKALAGENQYINSVLYADLGAFCHDIGVNYNGTSKKATAVNSAVTVNATAGSCYIVSNGRYFFCNGNICEGQSTVLVPVYSLVRAFGASTTYDSTTGSVNIIYNSNCSVTSGDKYYNSDDLMWLSRIIYAESRGESFMGKIAVGNVVMNRLKSDEYPDTVKEVIFDEKFGTQFTPASNGKVYNEPDSDSCIAAKLCLDGAMLSPDIMYFVNSDLATNNWVESNCTFVMTIGDHDFYA